MIIIINKTYNNISLPPWYENKHNITKVVVDDEINEGSSTAYWFYGLNNCSPLELEKLNVSKVTDYIEFNKHVTDKVISPNWVN